MVADPVTVSSKTRSDAHTARLIAMRSVKRQRLSELSRLGVFASVRNSIFSAKALAAAGLALLLANIWARRHEPRLHPRPVRGDVRRQARRGGVRLRHREHTYQIEIGRAHV